MIRLAIAEEHTLVRWAFRHAFAGVADIQVVGDAGTASETLALVRLAKPDVLLLDMTLPDQSGGGVLNELRELDDGPWVVMLDPHDQPSHGARAVAAGAHGYLAKSAEPEQLLEAIRKVSRGETVVPREVEANRVAGDPAAALTRREQQVMEMIARGMTNREVAEHLQIAQKTVDTHRGHILKKLGLRNNSDLTRFAVRHGYASL